MAQGLVVKDGFSLTRPKTLGIIGGSGLLKSELFQTFESTLVDTEFGKVKVLTGQVRNITLVFCQRHACDPDASYQQPRNINFRAIVSAFEKLEVDLVIGSYSVGSLKSGISIGTIVVPHDFFNPTTISHMSLDAKAHYVPEIDQSLRKVVVDLLMRDGIRVMDGGVYVQSAGPRFETPAEIKFFALVGDVIGMTAANEVELCNEVGIPIAMITMVDNFANSIVSSLTTDEFHTGQRRNKEVVEKVIESVVHYFAGKEPARDQTPAEYMADLIVSAPYMVTIDAPATSEQEDNDGNVLKDHAIVVKDGRILDILPSPAAQAKYRTVEWIQLANHVLMPGLVNAHTHSTMTTLRGLSDDKHLMEWLTKHIWPIEMKFMNANFVKLGTEMAVAEMVRSGTTCFNDMYFYPESTAEVLDRVGMRGVIGRTLMEFPSPYAANAAEYLAKGAAVAEKFSESELITFTIAPHAPYTVADETFLRVLDISLKEKINIHVHLHETAAECTDSEQLVVASHACHKSEYPARPIQNFQRLGLLGPSLIAVHMTQLSDEEIKLVADSKTNVVHCPTSNMKLASGFCPVAKLVAAGVNVAIGTDGCASNNTLDMFAEMKVAAILAKGLSGDPTAVPAFQALQMATINGARALGLEEKIGSLKIGKAADFIAVNLDDVEMHPIYNIISQLVYATTRDKVTDVWINGQRMLRDRELTTINMHKLRQDMDMLQKQIEEADAAIQAA